MDGRSDAVPPDAGPADAVPHDAEPAFVRSARFWLRAFPPRWRRVHEREALDLLVELASPGARRVGARDAIGLVGAGWTTRWRGRPGPIAWFGYRFFDAPASPRHRAWVADDIDGALYPLRASLPSWLVLGIAFGGNLTDRTTALLPVGWWLTAAGFGVLVIALRGNSRRHARERHLVAEPGEPLLPGTWVAMSGPRSRVTAAWAAPRARAAAAIAVVLGLLATVLAPSVTTYLPDPDHPATFELVAGAASAARPVILGLLALPALVGAVLAVRARRLLGTRLAELPTQPEREMVRPGWRVDAWFAVLLVAVGAATWGEISGATVLWLGPLLAAGGLALGPRLVVLHSAAARRAWRAPDGTALAWVDLSRLARSAAPVDLDQPQRVVRRWDGPAVPGQTVLGPAPADPPWPPIPA